MKFSGYRTTEREIVPDPWENSEVITVLAVHPVRNE